MELQARLNSEDLVVITDKTDFDDFSNKRDVQILIDVLVGNKPVSISNHAKYC